MYSINPPFVAVLGDVLQHPFACERFERIQAALPRGTSTEVVTEADLPDLFRRPELAGMGRHMGAFAEDPGGPALLFGLARYDGKLAERLERLGEGAKGYEGLLRDVLGYRTINWFNSGRESEPPGPAQDHVCRCAWRLNLMHGCPYRCAYCGLGKLLIALLNSDDYIVKLDELTQKNPWQTTYLYDDIAEAFALEPEYGAVGTMAEFFGRTPDRYLVIHTKSANVDFLREVDHRGHTIIVWSLSAQTQSHELERGSATMEERIEAARKCAEWGYQIRYKFKPMIPVVGWREEIAEMTKLLFERSRPDVISLFTLAWMKVDELLVCVPEERLDPEFVAAARRAEPEMRDTKVAPFPHEMRKRMYEFCYREIRKYDKEIPVSLSTETVDMWQDLGPLLGYNAGNYPCGCGSTSTPKLVKLPCSVWSVAKPVGVEVGV